jgi:two-component system cell cycle response regulator
MRTAIRIALAALVAGTGLLAALVLAGAPVGALDLVYDALLLGAPLACFGRVVASRRDRAAWALAGLGTLSWALGDLCWTFFIRSLEVEPFPSVADGLWLGFYPPVYVALILLLRARLHQLRAHVWLDGLIGALAVGAVAVAVVFGAVAATSEGTTWAIATNMAYPLADTILLALVVGALALTGWRADRALACLAGGFLLFGASDAIYLYQVATDTYVEWTLLDVGWPAAAVLIAVASWQSSRPRRPVDEGLVTLALPAVFAGAGLSVLVWDHFAPVHALALGLGATSVLAVIARMAITVAENLRMIRRSREEALTDSLTGLGNRRRLMLDLEHVASEPEPTALIVLDLNGFKAYNDVFGHPAGDALLSRLGTRLSAVTRGHGTAYRLGGDEFCALLAADDLPLELLEQACTSAMRENGEGFHVSAAQGSVLLPDEARDTSTALKLADQRMYANKHGARSSEGAQTSSALLQALTERSADLGDHLLGVAELAVAVARKLGVTGVEVEDIRLGASLHDVGKMAIPDAIIGKLGPLTDDEWHFVRNHTVAGEKILSAAPALHAVAQLVRSSHERYDGAGYPDGLAGSEIPLGSRIIFVCDAFDAIIAERVYRGPRTVTEAIAEIRRCAGTQFDPVVVEAFCEVMDDRSRLLAA